VARAWAEIDLAAVRANVETMRAVAAPASLCAVVKAGGYGHGAVPVAQAALDAGATWLAVAQVPEALELRAAGITAPVLLLSQPRLDEIAAAVAADLRVAAYDERFLEALSAESTAASTVTRVHLKVDTGMHRVGAPARDLVGLARAVDSCPGLALEGVWTHCAVADEPENPFTAQQLERFDAAVEALGAAGIAVPMRHAANSAAALTHPASRYDLVRCGIALYGMPPAPRLAGRVALEPVLRLASEVSHIQLVAAGEGISYGHRYRPERDTVVATVPVGYADGVFRSLPEAGQEVLIGGRRARMAGVVTMDQLMVDCGPGSRVVPGDEVVLLGAQGKERITPDEWAQRLGTISYEVVCALGDRVERRYIGS
jgi:alanine racemase